MKPLTKFIKDNIGTVKSKVGIARGEKVGSRILNVMAAYSAVYDISLHELAILCETSYEVCRRVRFTEEYTNKQAELRDKFLDAFYNDISELSAIESEIAALTSRKKILEFNLGAEYKVKGVGGSV